MNAPTHEEDYERRLVAVAAECLALRQDIDRIKNRLDPDRLYLAMVNLGIVKDGDEGVSAARELSTALSEGL